MAKTRHQDTEPKPTTSRRANEVRIREDDEPADDYFQRQADPYVLPPELNITIKDGFRFGLGFILASLVFYVIVIIGVIILVRFGGVLNIPL